MVERMQAGANFGSNKAGLLHASLEMYIKEFDDYVMRYRVIDIDLVSWLYTSIFSDHLPARDPITLGFI